MESEAPSRVLRGILVVAGKAKPMKLVAMSVACASLACALVPSAALADTPTHWSPVAPLPLPAGAATDGSDAESISCPAVGACVVVGRDEVDSSQAPLAEAQTSGGWEPQQVPLADGATSGSLRLVSCSAAASCVAIGEGAPAASPFLASDQGDAWTSEAAPLPEHGVDEYIDALSCFAASGCLAVGQATIEPSTGVSENVLLIVSGEPGSWQAEAVEPPASTAAGLDSVSCSANGQCVAVGEYVAGAHEPLLVAGAPGAWSVEALTLPSGTDEAVLNAVACPSSGSCTAVGWFTAAGSSLPLAVSQASGGGWEGTEVSPPASAEFGELIAVGCPSAERCAAVGVYKDAGTRLPLAAAESASGWTAEAPATAAQTTEAALKWISCPAAGSCSALGNEGGAYGELPIIVSQAESGWRTTELELPADVLTEQMASIGCAAPARCVVGGGYFGESSGLRAAVALSAPELELLTTSLPEGNVGVPYEAQLAGSGGSGSYTWSIASGALPAGLTLNATTGVISGTPTGAGASSFTVQASDGGPPAQTASGALTIEIAGASAGTVGGGGGATNPGAGTTVSPPPTSAPSTGGRPHLEPLRRPTVRIESRKLAIANGKLELRIACKDAACKGVMSVVAKLASRVKRHGKAKTVERSVVLAKTSYTLAAGKAKTFALKLPAKTRRALVISALLARRTHKRIEPQTATVTITVKRGTAQSKALKLAPSGKLKIVG